jgi:hypothetical protein
MVVEGGLKLVRGLQPRKNRVFIEECSPSCPVSSLNALKTAQ